MFFWITPMRLSIFIVTLNLAASSNIAVPCKGNGGSDTCNICLSSPATTSIPESPVNGLLQSYLEYEQLIINSTYAYSQFIWIYNNETVRLAQYMTFTLYIKYTGINGTGYPIPGCCQVPLTRKYCDAEEQVIGDIFYSINLFRSSLVIYEKHQTSMEYYNHKRREFPSTPPIFPDRDVPSTWLNYTRHKIANMYSYVCMFELSKTIFSGNNTLVSGPDAFQSHLFKRGVFDVSGFSYLDYKIMNEELFEKEINCTSRSFNTTEVYNLTSPNSNNQTLTCMVLWFTINNSGNADVSCMPHNATYPEIIVSPPIIKNEIDSITIVIIIVAVIATLLVFIIIAIRCISWRKNIHNFFKSTKELPATLQQTMATNDNFPKESKEKLSEETVTMFDEAERIKLEKHKEKIKTISNGKFQKFNGVNPLKLRIEHEQNEMEQIPANKTENSYIPKTMNTVVYTETTLHDLHEVDSKIGRKSGFSEDSGIGSGCSPLSDVSGHTGSESIYNQVFDEACNNHTDDDSGLASLGHHSPTGDVSDPNINGDSGLSTLTFLSSSTSRNFSSTNSANNSSVSADSGLSLPSPTRVSFSNDVTSSGLTNDSGLSSLSHQTFANEDVQKPPLGCDVIITKDKQDVLKNDLPFSETHCQGERLQTKQTGHHLHDRSVADDLVNNNNTVIQEHKLASGVYSRVSDFGFGEEQDLTPESCFRIKNKEAIDDLGRIAVAEVASDYDVNSHVPTQNACSELSCKETGFDAPKELYSEHNSLNNFHPNIPAIPTGYSSKDVFCDPP